LRTDTCDTDKELFTRIAEGDEAAFIRLFHLYVPQIKPVITTNREKLTEVKAPRSWIFSVVYYQCFNYLRRQSVRNKVEPGIFPINDAPTQWQESPESLLQFNETRSFIKQAIDGLPPQAKKIYLLSREQGLRIDEIATRLGLAPKTVKNTLTRASTSIRQFLQQKGVYLPLILLVIEINKFQ
jgi:RNA polymerase sigma-70 factor (ECF subfamily)